MVWVRLTDDFTDHPKVVAAGPLASWLFVCGLAYANRYLTDGFIPAAHVRRLADVDDPNALADVLVQAGLWEADGERSGYLIHDFHDYQPSADEVKRERERGARRQAVYGNPAITRGVRERDGNACRYCGIRVDWSDRRGPNGGTYDHVNPNGSADPSNLVVACRGCTSRKDGRTPPEAGMKLRRISGRNPAEDVTETRQESGSARQYPATSSGGPDPDPDPDPDPEKRSVPGSSGLVSGAVLSANALPQRANGAHRTAKISRSTPVPDAFTVDDRLAAFGADLGLSADRLAEETAHFLDHHRAKGSRFNDWPAAWRGWMRRAVKYDAATPSLGQSPARRPASDAPTDNLPGGDDPCRYAPVRRKRY